MSRSPGPRPASGRAAERLRPAPKEATVFGSGAAVSDVAVAGPPIGPEVANPEGAAAPKGRRAGSVSSSDLTARNWFRCGDLHLPPALIASQRSQGAPAHAFADVPRRRLSGQMARFKMFQKWGHRPVAPQRVALCRSSGPTSFPCCFSPLRLRAATHLAPRDPSCEPPAAPYVVSRGLCAAPDAALCQSPGPPGPSRVYEYAS